MATRVKKKLDVEFLVPNIERNFARKVSPVARDAIISTILAGISPVTGKRFKKYSEAYAVKKGQKRPVDMSLSGKMLDSLKVRTTSKGSISFVFTDFKAAIHNNGEGKQPMRKLLPSKNKENFTGAIEKRIQKVIDKLVDDEILKQNT
jgi:hypothetical protein